MGLKDIVQNLTGWAPGIGFGSVFTYQDTIIDLRGSIGDKEPPFPPSSSASSSPHLSVRCRTQRPWFWGIDLGAILDTDRGATLKYNQPGVKSVHDSSSMTPGEEY